MNNTPVVHESAPPEAQTPIPSAPVIKSENHILLKFRNALRGDLDLSLHRSTPISQVKHMYIDCLKSKDTIYPEDIRFFTLGKEMKTGDLQSYNLKDEMTI